MLRSRYIKIVLACFFLVLIGFGSYFLGDKYAIEHLSIIRVSPEQLSQAMKSDHFYSSYRENTLLVSGQVLKVGPINGPFEIVFAGSNSFPVSCQFAKGTAVPIVGSQISIISEAARAVRLPAGVQLKNCVFP